MIFVFLKNRKSFFGVPPKSESSQKYWVNFANMLNISTKFQIGASRVQALSRHKQTDRLSAKASSNNLETSVGQYLGVQ